MTKDQIKNYIITEFIPSSHPEEITDELDLIQHNIIDSLGFLKLVAHIERQNDITIDIEDIDFDNFNTINRIYRVVNAKVKTSD